MKVDNKIIAIIVIIIGAVFLIFGFINILDHPSYFFKFIDSDENMTTLGNTIAGSLITILGFLLILKED